MTKTKENAAQNGKIYEEVNSAKSADHDDLEADLEEFYKEMPLTDETSCGMWMFKGPRLQSLANKKVLILLFGLSGCCFSSTFAYFNGTITTMEKRFRIPSKTTGIISVGNDITQLLASVILNYYAARGHRPRWIAFGLYCVATFCFLNALPHLIYGPGEDALQLTFEYGADFIHNSTTNQYKQTSNKNLCSIKENQKCTMEDGSIIPPVIWFTSQLISGIGGTLFYSLGYSYMDDNIKKSKSPVFISFSYFMRMLGPALGYAVVSVCLKFYIAPKLTPTIDNLDPRWLGAWWLGWLILGASLIVLASLVALLPKTLPRAAARKELLKQRENKSDEETTQTSLRDMLQTIKRLIYNRVYNYNNLASIFFVFGFIPFWIFLPKYIETQYRKSASIASLVTGTVGLVFAALGILLAGMIVQKFKPKARYMACWNMIIDIISLMGIITYSFLGCPAVDEQMPIFSDGKLITTQDCNADCMCDYVKFSPVCSIDKKQTFISACHAGCTQQTILEDGMILFSNCSCILPTVNPDMINKYIEDMEPSIYGAALSGPCAVDCHYQFYSFVAIICILKLIGSLSRVTNFLVSVRCVEERDKTVSLGITMATISMFALIPAPIFYGYIIDSTCLVWGKTCAGIGNCWFFNAALLRKRIIYTSVVFIIIGVFFDVAVWWNVNDLNMFDDGLQMKDAAKKSDDKSSNPDDTRMEESSIVNS